MITKYTTKFGETLEEFARNESSSKKPLVNQIEDVKELFPKGAILRRMGTTAGVVAPYIGAFLLSNYFSGDISSDETIREMYALALFYGSSAIVTLTGAPVFSGILGYKAGKKLDNLVDEVSSKIKESN